MDRGSHSVQRGRQIAASRPGMLTRRGVVAGALGAAGASAIGAGLARPGGGFADLRALAALQETNIPLPEIPELTSENGLLSLTLVATGDASRGQSALGYALSTDPADPDGIASSPGPTLRVRRGDRLRIRLVNDLAAMTNLHVHGLHVSPIDNGDNVFVHVHANAFFDFEYQIPDNHRSGLFWYHPHFHGTSQDQVGKGLAGAIIVDESTDDLAAYRDEPPVVKGVPERLLILQHLSLLGLGSFHINGAVSSDIPFRPGQWERWRIVNASSDTFLNLYLDGLPFYRVAVDGNWLAEAVKAPVLPIGPAERAEALILWGSQPTYQLSALFSNQFGFPNERSPVVAEPGTLRQPLARLVAEETAVRIAGTPVPPPTTLFQRSDLREVPNPPGRTLRFMLGAGFQIDGKGFSHGRVDQTVALNSVERWTIHNDTGELEGWQWHPLHIHVNDFQVESINPFTEDPTVTPTVDPVLGSTFFTDTVPLPPKGNVKILAEFLDFTGRFVYHCHILEHEDNGMMGVIEVVHPVRIAPLGFEPASVPAICGPALAGGDNSGTTVVWTNVDEHGVHTVTAADVDAITGVPLFDSGDLLAGRSFAHTFDAPGTVAYHCAHHPDEQGVVVVTALKTIEIWDDAFDPATVEVATGTTISWTNRDPSLHTVTASQLDPATGEPLFASGPLDQEASFSHTFTTPGEYPYLGTVDFGMEGLVIVRDVTRRSVSIGIFDDGLDQHEVFVPAGTTVTWANRANQGFMVRSIAPAFDSGLLDPEIPVVQDQPFRPGQRFSQRFAEPLTVKYSVVSSDGLAKTHLGTIQVVP